MNWLTQLIQGLALAFKAIFGSDKAQQHEVKDENPHTNLVLDDDDLLAELRGEPRPADQNRMDHRTSGTTREGDEEPESDRPA